MGKTDITGIAILAAVGFVGYGLLKSDFFKGVGEVGSGIGTAVGGTGAAISDIAGDASQVTSNIADFTDPLGAMGTAIANNMQQISDLSQQLRQREWEQENYLDVNAFDKNKEQLTNIQAGNELYSAEQGSLRKKDWEETKTNVQDNLTDWVEQGSSLLTKNPVTSVFSWVKNQVSSLRTPKITGAAVSTGNEGVSNSSSSSSSKTSSLKSSSITYPSYSSSTDKTMSLLGYSGQSTASGVVYTKTPINTGFGTFTPVSSIRKPVKKSFLDKLTFWN